MLPYARHDLLMISDSNVRIEPGDLTKIVAPMRDSRVGLVYQLVGGRGETTVAAALENLRFTEIAGPITAALKLVTTMDAGTGKGMLFRRQALVDIGGLARVREAAAEDFVLCRAIRRAGWKLRMAAAPVRAIHVKWSLRNVVRRHLRHASMRRHLCPWGYPAELLVNPIVMSIPLVVVGGVPGLAAALGVVAAKTAIEAATSAIFRERAWPLKYALLIPFKDLLTAAIWLASFGHNTIRWRDRLYRLGPGERITPLDRQPTHAEPGEPRRAA
jgi:ceramide glucosyltransferase